MEQKICKQGECCMIKGDKIKLIKPMGVFTNIGEICEVIDVGEGGVISFKFGNGLHLGCMSYDEFQKYFELVKEKPKRKWSEWKREEVSFNNIFNTQIKIGVRYRENGKKVQIKAYGIKGESTCSKYDEFDIVKGFELAKKRFIVKFLEKSVIDYAKTL